MLKNGGTLFNLLEIISEYSFYKSSSDLQNPRLPFTPIDELKAIGKDHSSPHLTECSSSVKAGHSPLSSTPGVHSELGQHSG